MAGPYANPFDSPPGGSGPPGGLNPLSQDQNFYYNQNPLAGYYAWLYGQSPKLWGDTKEAQYGQNQFGRYQNQFSAEAARDPSLQWYDWLQGKGSGIHDEYAGLDPTTRGDFSDRLYSNRGRWVMGG